jgi:alpha-glucosidase (family GH31 glycosyl hydrolase)
VTRWELTTNHPNGITLTVVTRLIAPGVLSIQMTPSRPAEIQAVGVCLPAAPGEHLFGFGERAGHLDLAGQVVDNWTADQAHERGQHTSYAPTPFLLSSRGYGLLLDTTAHATFDLRTDRAGCYRVRVDAPQLALYLIAGPHPQTVLERHARLVGLPPLPPRWAFGVWKNLIGGQARVVQDVARLRRDGVPIDAIWIYDAVDDRAGFGWPWPVYGPIAPDAILISLG